MAQTQPSAHPVPQVLQSSTVPGSGDAPKHTAADRSPGLWSLQRGGIGRDREVTWDKRRQGQGERKEGGGRRRGRVKSEEQRSSRVWGHQARLGREWPEDKGFRSSCLIDRGRDR